MRKYNRELLLEKADLVLNRLMNLENRQFDKDVNPWSGKAGRDFGIKPWDWPQGVGLYGMEKLQKLYGDTRYDDFFVEWIRRNQEEGLPSANINTTAPYNMVLAMERRHGNPGYKKMCIERAEWLISGLPKTEEGGFQHVTTDLYDKNGTIQNEGQLWVDTLFMAVMFLAQAGVAYGRSEWIDEAVYQIQIHIKYLYDKNCGLLHHGWSFLRKDNFGGIFWARGNSWFTYGILELMDILVQHISAPQKRLFTYTFHAQVEALEKLQAEDGLWHTILDDPSSYEEVSGTAAIAAALFKAIRIGVLDDSHLPYAERALDGILKNITADGSVLQVSAGTAIGLDAEHYKNIIIDLMPYGQSMVVLTLTEALEYYDWKENNEEN